LALDLSVHKQLSCMDELARRGIRIPRGLIVRSA
jgi:hypothetical protein